MAFVAGGSFPASITPMAQQVTVQDNYLDFNALAVSQWAQQYLPELYEQEVERYGNRTLSGFLRMVGAEMPMTSDQVIWSEQNRLHIAYDTVQVTAGALSQVTATITPQGVPAETTAGVRIGNTILISDNATGLVTVKGLVTNVVGFVLTVELYTTTSAALVAAGTTITGAADQSLFVYGSEFPKGSNGMAGAIEPGVTTFYNSPVILKACPVFFLPNGMPASITTPSCETAEPNSSTTGINDSLTVLPKIRAASRKIAP